MTRWGMRFERSSWWLLLLLAVGWSGDGRAVLGFLDLDLDLALAFFLLFLPVVVAAAMTVVVELVVSARLGLFSGWVGEGH